MGLKDIKKYFSTKTDGSKKNQTNSHNTNLTDENTPVKNIQEQVIYNGNTFKIDRNKMSENYFEPIYYNGQLVDIIAVVKPIKSTHRCYRHYRSLEDFINHKSITL